MDLGLSLVGGMGVFGNVFVDQGAESVQGGDSALLSVALVPVVLVLLVELTVLGILKISDRMRFFCKFDYFS